MKLNLGSGLDYREGYVNIDFADVGSNGEPIKVDLKFDFVCNSLLEKYDFNSVDEILFFETLEHFNRWDGLKILEDIFCIIKPGGVLKLSVPPAKIQMIQLLKAFDVKISMDDFRHAHKKFSAIKFLDDLCGATFPTIKDNKDFAHGASHKCFYSKVWLECLLKEIGFKINKINDEIYVEATK